MYVYPIIGKVDRGVGRGTVNIVLGSTQQLHITHILDIECDTNVSKMQGQGGLVQGM